MRVSIFDYGVGNVHSLFKAVSAAGATAEVVTQVSEAVAADALILPGVGAFEPAAGCLSSGRDMLRASIRNGLPTLGICLGMQLLFDESEEGVGKGLGVFAGPVTKLRAHAVPHIGWNTLEEAHDEALASTGLDEVYYAHSFACRASDQSVVTAWSQHEGDRFPAIVRRGKVMGVQFHPEKSSARGVAFLRHFLQEATA